jgi:hypothetical protein
MVAAYVQRHTTTILASSPHPRYFHYVASRQTGGTIRTFLPPGFRRVPLARLGIFRTVYGLGDRQSMPMGRLKFCSAPSRSCNFQVRCRSVIPAPAGIETPRFLPGFPPAGTTCVRAANVPAVDHFKAARPPSGEGDTEARVLVLMNEQRDDFIAQIQPFSEQGTVDSHQDEVSLRRFGRCKPEKQRAVTPWSYGSFR